MAMKPKIKSPRINDRKTAILEAMTKKPESIMTEIACMLGNNNASALKHYVSLAHSELLKSEICNCSTETPVKDSK